MLGLENDSFFEKYSYLKMVILKKEQNIKKISRKEKTKISPHMGRSKRRFVQASVRLDANTLAGPGHSAEGLSRVGERYPRLA